MQARGLEAAYGVYVLTDRGRMAGRGEGQAANTASTHTAVILPAFLFIDDPFDPKPILHTTSVAVGREREQKPAAAWG